MPVPSVEMMLIAGRAVFLVFSFVVAAVTLVRWRNAARAQTAEMLAHNAVVLQRLADLEARIDATRLAITELPERVGRQPQGASAPGSAAPGYQIAIRLARGGASREELISGCGLSLHEAELVQRLHGPTPAAQRARSA
ncbi:MAG TPA: DUF2802 domain-containing protein [Steroidobacteraceae bacterium]